MDTDRQAKYRAATLARVMADTATSPEDVESSHRFNLIIDALSPLTAVERDVVATILTRARLTGRQLETLCVMLTRQRLGPDHIAELTEMAQISAYHRGLAEGARQAAEMLRHEAAGGGA